ncbi:ABC transporter substrate-binding protein [Noviherbaspirillum sp. Root189]|uniref:ABC transporter substrate-binding protein n=1 Tax=Noviherbaspirillum sp. Root189 TaxID=1736487 RepID=UPI00070BD235|nr:ABC transporter substrate-binding protein [Noviherbaspirillum sp. Root189]KRB93546.1 hypothetical protein ASE07_12685 [Noviherbaspirillum sp. Root189]
MKIIKALCLVAALISPTVFAQTKMVVGYTAVTAFAALYVAKEQKIFDKHGLDVTPQLVALSGVLPAALQSDSIQVGASATPVLIQAADSGMDLVAFANASVNARPATEVGLIVRTGANIRSAQDLAGKKIGVPGLNAALHIMARQWLAGKGVDPKKVSFTEIAFPQMNDVLKAGTVDAVMTADPFLLRILQAGTGSLLAYVMQELPEGFSQVLYMTTREWAGRNPVALRAFRDALKEAERHALAHPEQARQAIGKYVRVPPEVLASLQIPKLKTEIEPNELAFFDKAMREQNMLRNPPKLNTLIVK